MSWAVITLRLLCQVFLVFLFRIIPLGGSPNLCCDGFAFIPLLSNLFLDFLGNFQLFVIFGKDRRAVLGASVCALPIQGSGIVHFEEVLDQLAIRDSVGVEDKQERFGVAGFARA